jgi:hypothetical protein
MLEGIVKRRWNKQFSFSLDIERPSFQGLDYISSKDERTKNGFFKRYQYN